MNVDSRTETISATGQIRLSNANFFFLVNTTLAISIAFNRKGTAENFQNTLAGLNVGRVKPWDYAYIVGTPGTVLTFFYGFTELREDLTDFRSTLASISGTVATTNQPSSALVDTADTAQGTGTQTVIAANLARRRITIGVPNASLNPVRVSQAGGAARGIEIAPGTYTEFDTTAALTVRNDTAGAATWYAFEES